MPIPEENILVVPRTLFDEVGAFQGLQLDVQPYLDKFFRSGSNMFLPRRQAETNPGFKQLIPYALVLWENRVLAYQRGSGGEARLTSKRSIGIGGHINQSDTEMRSVTEGRYSELVLRELNEELVIDGIKENRIVALLNDDSNDVGRVHLGIIHRIRLSTSNAAPREPDIVRPKFNTIDELTEGRETLETWSQLCCAHLQMLMEAKGIIEDSTTS